MPTVCLVISAMDIPRMCRRLEQSRDLNAGGDRTGCGRGHAGVERPAWQVPRVDVVMPGPVLGHGRVSQAVTPKAEHQKAYVDEQVSGGWISPSRSVPRSPTRYWMVRTSPATPTTLSSDPSQARARSTGRTILTLPHRYTRLSKITTARSARIGVPQ